MYVVQHSNGHRTKHHHLPNDGDATFAVNATKCEAFFRDGSGFEAPWVKIDDQMVRCMKTLMPVEV